MHKGGELYIENEFERRGEGGGERREDRQKGTECVSHLRIGPLYPVHDHW